MRAKWYNSLLTSIFTAYIFSMLLSISFLITIIFENQIDLISENATLKSEITITKVIDSLRLFSGELQESRLFNQSKALQELNSIIKNHVKKYAFYTEAGIISFKSPSLNSLPDEYVTEGLQAATQKTFSGKEYTLSIHEKERRIFFYIPLHEFGLEKTILFIEHDLDIVESKMNTLLRQSAYIVTVLLLLNIVFVLLFFKKVISPLHRLGRASREIASGDFSSRVTINQKSELGALGSTFNMMAQTIQNKIDALSKKTEELEATKKSIEKLSINDELTGLANRTYLLQRLSSEFSRALRSHSPLSLIILDIDYFKQCNDTYGQAAGDLILKMMAKTLVSISRSMDIIARYGGDEIAIIAPECGRENLPPLLERIRLHIQDKGYDFEGRAIKITLSIGAACFSHDEIKQGYGVDLLVKTADDALNEAKRQGRNCFVIGEV